MLSSLPAATPRVRFSVSAPQIVPSVLVDMLVQDDTAEARSQLAQLGVQHLSVFKNLISGWLPVDRIKDAAALQSVKFIRTSRSKTRTGSITSQGDFVQHSDLLRASTQVPGLTGAGITVGVLSDSFNCVPTVTDAATDEATGDLPATVQVLEEFDATLESPPQPLPATAPPTRAAPSCRWCTTSRRAPS